MRALFGRRSALSKAPPSWKGRDWDALPVQEKAVQWAAHYADHVRVRERPVNRGFWVERFLAYVGLGPGYAWCAAFASEVTGRAGWFKFKSAAVLQWHRWARENGVIVTEPERGCLAYWIVGSGKNQRRHIEFVVGTERLPYIRTIGGNTGPGEGGSQEEGDGVYRRERHRQAFTGYIKWWLVK